MDTTLDPLAGGVPGQEPPIPPDLTPVPPPPLQNTAPPTLLPVPTPEQAAAPGINDLLYGAPKKEEVKAIEPAATDINSLLYGKPKVEEPPPPDLNSVLYGTPPPVAPAPTSPNADLLYGPYPGAKLKPEAERGAFGRGVAAGGYQAHMTIAALKGLADKALLGDQKGFEDSMSLAAIYDNKANALAPKYGIIDSVTKGTVGDILSALGYALGTQAQTISTIVISGGAAGALTKMAAEAYTKKLISKEIRDQIITTAVRRATVAGAYVSTTAMETAGTATEAYQATGDVNVGVAALAGAGKGALELIVPGGLAAKWGFGEAVDAGLLHYIESSVAKRFGQSALGQFVGGAAGTAAGAGLEEMTTEAVQETVDAAARAYVDKNYKFLSTATRDRILESAAQGLLIGGISGGVTGGGTARHEAPQISATEADIAAKIAAASGGVTSPPPAPGSATAQAVVASSPSAEVGSVRNVANGPVPTLDDLPKKVVIADIQSASGLTVPPAAIPHVVQAIMSRNSAVRLAARNADPKQVAKEQGKADAALTAAHAAGLTYAPGTSTNAPVLASGTAVGGGEATTPSGTAGTISAAASTTTPIASGASDTTVAGSTTLPTTTGGAGTVSTPTPTPTTTAAAVIPPTGVAVETAKAIPKDANPHVDAILQAFRDIINEEGGIGKLLPAMKAAFLGNAPRSELLGGIRSRIEFLAFRAFATQRNISPKTISASLNLDTGEMEIQVKGKPDIKFPIPPETLTRYAKEVIQGEIVKGQPTLSLTLNRNEHLHGVYRASPRGGNIGHDPESTLSDGLGVTPVQTADGKTIAWQDMKPGQVAWTGVPGFFDAKSLRFFERLIAKFMPGEKLILQVEKQPDALGSYSRFPNNFNVITIEPITSQAWNFPQVSILFHEVGHMLMHHVFKNESLAVQTAIYNAYLAEIQKGTVKDVAFNISGPFDTQTTLTRGTSLLSDEGFLKWFNFDEWIAEQVSRYFMTNERAAGFVDRFFSKAASKMKSMWASMFTGYEARTGKPYVANAVVAEWLESVYMNRKTGQPLLMPASIEAMRESSIENLKWSNQKDTLDPLTNSLEDLIAAAPPEQPQSAAIRQVEKKLGFWGNGQVAAQSDKYNWWVRTTWNLLQIAEQNPAIATLQQYVGLVRQWSITRMQFISRSDTTLKTWRRLGREMAANLNAFLYDVDSLDWLPKGARARWPNPAEEAALVAKHKLTPAAMAVYASIRSQFGEVLDRLEKAWIGSAMQIRDPIQQAVKLMEINKQMQMLRVKPYFPHSRYGDWTLSVKNAKGKLVFFQQFESQRARDEAMAPARAQYPGHTVTGDKTPGEMQQFSGIPPGILRDLQGRLGLTVSQQQVLDAFIFDMSPANSFAQKFQKRKNIKGFDLNAQRAFSNYFIHAAGHIARLEYGEQLQRAITDTRTTARGDLTGRRQNIADWMQRHLDYIMHPPNEWTAVRSVAFMHHLAYSPGAALINLTQVPMVAAPYLSSRFGNLKIIPAFTRAGLDIRKMYDDPKNSRLPQDETDALDEWTLQGTIDQAQATELAAASENGTMTRFLSGTQLQRGIAWAGHWSSYLFQAAEKVNRKIVAMTAYRLAKQNPATPYLAQLEAANPALFQDLLSKGWSPENARAFLAGRDAVDKTQFEYARWNRPEFMRGKKGIIFTFYMYKQNMLHFFAHQPGGYKALALVLAFAGLQGLPWEEELNDLLRGITELLGIGRFDANLEMRKLLTELNNRPDLIMHGLGRETWGLGLLGDALGIPIPSVDVSGSMGFGQIEPLITPIVHGLETGQNFKEQLGNVVAAAAGATIGVGLGYAKMLESGDLTSLRTWMPALPRWLKNIAQAYDLATQGGYVNNAGAKVVKFDMTDTKTMAEILAQGLGFTPTKIAGYKERTSAELDAANYWKMRRNILLNNLWDAFQTKDKDGIKHVIERIQYFNRTAPDPGLSLKSQSIVSSMRNKAQSKARMEQNIAPNKTLFGLQEQVKKLYPEVQ